MAKAQQLGISAERWIPHDQMVGDRRGRPFTSCLLFVSADMVQTEAFMADLGCLHVAGRLARIVVDEVHLVESQGSFRPVLAHLDRVQRPGVQVVLLTATLPPTMVQPVFDTLGMPPETTVVRADTSRTNISYEVHKCATKELLAETVLFQLNLRQPRERAIVYCRKLERVSWWATRLGGIPYHGSLDPREAAQNLAEWMDDEDGSSVIVASTALGCGVDAPRVSVVVHVEQPYDLLEFVQGSGRAGREEHMLGRSIIVTSDAGNAAIREERQSTMGNTAQQALDVYLGGTCCRRQAIARYMDEPGARFTRATCREYDVVFCDVCLGNVAHDTLQTREPAPAVVLTVPQAMQRVRTREENFEAVAQVIQELRQRCLLCWLARNPNQGHAPRYCMQREMRPVFVMAARMGPLVRYRRVCACGMPREACLRAPGAQYQSCPLLGICVYAAAYVYVRMQADLAQLTDGARPMGEGAGHVRWIT